MEQCGNQHPRVNEDPEEQGDKHLEVLVFRERLPDDQDFGEQEQDIEQERELPERDRDCEAHHVGDARDRRGAEG